MTESDKYGEQVQPGSYEERDICGMVVDLPDGRPSACAYTAGHRSLHSWANLPGARSSRPPGPRGEDRTSRARR